ncbi:Fur family transcriptional regulator [candidate division KSB1 bacterium]
MSSKQNIDLNELRSLLEEKGIQSSIQRLKILEYLINNKNHPNADMIYKKISMEIPTLSKTTVYNTLHNFMDKGIVSGLTIDENEMRFDYYMDHHLHFKCEKCKSVYDINVEFNDLKKDFINGHKILYFQIYYNGICKNCLKKD